ncbi:MAG: hypothetical protein ABI970_16855 [Chloroflexota bacterium]
MSKQTGAAPQPTHPLKQFDVLIGEWDTVGTHPQIESPVKGHSKFEWLVDGGLLVWHFNWEPKLPPDAVNVIGHDDTGEICTVLYSDERGVSRILQMTLEGNLWKMWRNSPDFSQRMTGEISDDQNTIVVKGELSRDGSTWEQDLDVTYTRKK